jgi:hypothetical protein
MMQGDRKINCKQIEELLATLIPTLWHKICNHLNITVYLTYRYSGIVVVIGGGSGVRVCVCVQVCYH